MHLLTLNAAGKSIAPARTLDPSRRRLSQVIGRHVDRSRPHMIAVQRARDPLQPLDEAWVTRGRDKAGKINPWPRRYLPADAVVVVVYLPRGGLGGSSGSRGGGKSALSIAAGIAGLALVAFAGPIAAALLPSLIFGSVAPFLLQAGLVIGGTALLSLASKSKANKQATDTTQIYGVAGGGNLPKPGDRIPRGYGRSWMKPDLSQPDFSQYAGDDQILLKRHTLGVGKYRPYKVRAGKQVMWQEGSGFVPPFDDIRNKIEFIYGTASTLVPSNVVAASGVGGTLPRPADNPSIAGPFLINQRGALITRIQVDYQFPGGVSSSATKESGAQLSNLPGFWSVLFEYAPIDESGAITGAWAPVYDGSNNTEGPLFSTHPLRYTKFKDVPAGRYAVRGRNRMPDTTGNQGIKGKAVNVDAVQWDAASGWVGDVAVRPGVTEMALRIYATKGNQAAAFGEIEIDAAAIIPVWTGSAWVEQETSKAVWAYLDVMRNADYGGAISDDQLDLGTALYYAGALSEFDTFDASIRGPVSVYEAAATALLPMRAEPVHLGRYWSLVRDEPKSVRRHMITRGQMLKGSSQITFDLDTESGAGHVIGEFDQDGDYRSPNQSTAIYGAASLTPTRQRWTGVRTFRHATHLTRWRAASGAFRRQATPFGVEMEGRIYKRGDSISVDPWFIDVRKKANVVDNRGDTLVLDADVPVTATDAITLRDRDGREWGPLAIAGQGTGTREITLSTASRQQLESATGRALSAVLSDGRRDMTTVLVGALVDLQENYLIQSVKPDGVSRAQVEALIDDPRVWAAIGAAVGNPPSGYTGIIEPESPAILSLTANAVPVAAGFRLDYTIRPGRGARSFEVGLSYDSGNRFDTRADAGLTGSIDLNPVDPITLVLRARAFGPSGLPGVYVYTPVGLPAATVNALLPPITYESLDALMKAQIDRLNGIQKKAEDAAAAAQQALTDALARVDLVRKAIARDPAVRQAFIDPLIQDVRSDIDILTQSVTKNLQDVSALRDALTTAGLETIPSQGRVRFYAIEALQTSVGTTISNFSVTVDALSKKIDLYGSVQTGDLSGLIQSITTVQTTLNALQGTISSYVTAAQFSPVEARVGTAETRLDAQAASIASKASQQTVDQQGTRLTSAEQRISASEGRIFQAVQASSGQAADADLIPRTLSGFFDFVQRQQAVLAQTVAVATTNLSANIDEQRRATAESTTALAVRVDDNAAAIIQSARVAADANSATVTVLQGLSAVVGQNAADVVTLYQAQATDRATTASLSSSVSARFDTNEANIAANQAAVSSLSSATASADLALGSRIDTVTVRLGAAEGSIVSEATARASADGVLTTQYNGLVSRVGGVEAGVSIEASARATGDAANASNITTLFAQSAAGTAGGRVGFTAVSAPSGVSVRYAIQISTDAGGQMRNAGMYFDIMPDGTSRVVFDANLFAITANGGLSYPLTFDGQTLRVPALVLTAGQASSPLRIDIGSYTLISGAGKVNNRVDPNLNFTFNVPSADYPSTINVFGLLSATGTATIQGMQILVDGQPRGYMLFNGQSSSWAGGPGGAQASFQGSCLLYLGAGNHTVQFQYTYDGPSAASKIQIDEIHVAGFTPRA